MEYRKMEYIIVNIKENTKIKEYVYADYETNGVVVKTGVRMNALTFGDKGMAQQRAFELSMEKGISHFAISREDNSLEYVRKRIQRAKAL